MSTHEFFMSNFIFVRYNMYEIYIFTRPLQHEVSANVTGSFGLPSTTPM